MLVGVTVEEEFRMRMGVWKGGQSAGLATLLLGRLLAAISMVQESLYSKSGEVARPLERNKAFHLTRTSSRCHTESTCIIRII